MCQRLITPNTREEQLCWAQAAHSEIDINSFSNRLYIYPPCTSIRSRELAHICQRLLTSDTRQQWRVDIRLHTLKPIWAIWSYDPMYIPAVKKTISRIYCAHRIQNLFTSNILYEHNWWIEAAHLLATYHALQRIVSPGQTWTVMNR